MKNVAQDYAFMEDTLGNACMTKVLPQWKSGRVCVKDWECLQVWSVYVCELKKTTAQFLLLA